MSTQFQEYARRNAGGGTIQQRGHAVHQRAGAAEGGKRGRRGRGPPLPVTRLPPPCLFTCRLLCCFGIPSLSHVSVQVLAAPSNIFGPGKVIKMVCVASQTVVSHKYSTHFTFEGFCQMPIWHVSISNQRLKGRFLKCFIINRVFWTRRVKLCRYALPFLL